MDLLFLCGFALAASAGVHDKRAVYRGGALLSVHTMPETFGLDLELFMGIARHCMNIPALTLAAAKFNGQIVVPVHCLIEFDLGERDPALDLGFIQQPEAMADLIEIL